MQTHIHTKHIRYTLHTSYHFIKKKKKINKFPYLIILPTSLTFSPPKNIHKHSAPNPLISSPLTNQTQPHQKKCSFFFPFPLIFLHFLTNQTQPHQKKNQKTQVNHQVNLHANPIIQT